MAKTKTKGRERRVSVTLRPDVYSILAEHQFRIRCDGGNASLQHLLNEAVLRVGTAETLPAEVRS